MSHHDTNDGHFIVPVKYYVMTLLVLVVMTTVTVYTAKYIDLGWGNIVFAMAIAITKASFVVMFFMGLRWDKGVLNVAVFFSSIVVFLIFIVFVVYETSTRDGFTPEEFDKQNLKTPVKIEK